MKLRNKVMVILIVTVLLSMAGSGVFFFQQYKSAFQQSVFRTIDAAAKANAETLSNYLSTQHEIAKHIADMLPKEAVEYKDYLWIESYLGGHFKDFTFFNNGFFFLDTHGTLLADYPPHPELRGKNFSNRPYFQRTMATKKGVIGQPYRSARTGKGVLTFTSYLTARDGTPLGVVGCSTRLAEDKLFSELLSRTIGQSGYIYVFDKSRLMILHPKTERILTRDVPLGANILFDKAIEGFEGVGETVNSKGKKMLAAFRQIPGTDWIVASQLPAAEAYAPLWKSQKVFILFIVLGSIVAACCGLVFVHRSLRELNTLEKVTADLATPETSTVDISTSLRADISKLDPLLGHPEFGSLAKTIAGLYEKLGLSLVESRQMTTELDAAYQKLKATQSQILQQEKLASVGQLAAGVAHEINNPMGFITSNLASLKRYQDKLAAYIAQLEEWLQGEGSEEILLQLQAFKKKQKIDYVLEDINDLIAESSEGAVRVRDIVQNLKSFSRVDQTELTDADLNECLESTLAIAMNEIKYKATVVKDFGSLPPIPCYPQQLNQVFLNILVNAAQAIEEKGEIKITTRVDQNKVVVAISDNGSGIPVDIKDKIFEPFFTTKEVGKGTGLGLSISFDIIKEHQGQIWIESEEGQGTTFIIELPLEREGVTS